MLFTDKKQAQRRILLGSILGSAACLSSPG